MSSRRQLLAWQERWATPAAIAALGAVAFVLAAIVVGKVGVGGGGNSELLRNVQAHRSAEILSVALQSIGVALLAAPLYYLFRIAKERSERMRGGLVGVVIAAPLFLFFAAILTGVSTLHGASNFVTSEVPHLLAKKVALDSDRANEVAADTLNEAPLRSLAAGFGLAGVFGFTVAMAYTCFHAMRVGLLTRFWGSLGMALGIVSLLFFEFALLWFVYFGLLVLGLVPGGKPPAWASGEAVPWPTPGERAAASLEGGEGPDAGEEDETETRE